MTIPLVVLSSLIIALMTIINTNMIEINELIIKKHNKELEEKINQEKTIYKAINTYKKIYGVDVVDLNELISKDFLFPNDIYVGGDDIQLSLRKKIKNISNNLFVWFKNECIQDLICKNELFGDVIDISLYINENRNNIYKYINLEEFNTLSSYIISNVYTKENEKIVTKEITTENNLTTIKEAIKTYYINKFVDYLRMYIENLNIDIIFKDDTNLSIGYDVENNNCFSNTYTCISYKDYQKIKEELGLIFTITGLNNININLVGLNDNLKEKLKVILENKFEEMNVDISSNPILTLDFKTDTKNKLETIEKLKTFDSTVLEIKNEITECNNSSICVILNNNGMIEYYYKDNSNNYIFGDDLNKRIENQECLVNFNDEEENSNILSKFTIKEGICIVIFNKDNNFNNSGGDKYIYINNRWFLF